MECCLLVCGLLTDALDRSLKVCLALPWRAQYGGGIIVNPEFNLNSVGWSMLGNGQIRKHMSNKYIVVHNRTNPIQSISQKVPIQSGQIYSFSAWVQISKGSSETVIAVFNTSKGRLLTAGKVVAKQGCWSFLKGGFHSNTSGHAYILFQSKNLDVDILIDSVSLQPFTMKQWKAHQEKSIQKGRKSNVQMQVTYGNKTIARGARISVKQLSSDFPLGCGMNYHILESTFYQNWFASRFKYATFTNEMKWYTNEKNRGQENYTLADSMLNFTKQNGISVRGHNIFWDDPRYQPKWVPDLSPEELGNATKKRLHSVVTRYGGQVIAWDVVNENLHFKFFEDKLGQNASSDFYVSTYKLDQDAVMFLNEYNTIEDPNDYASGPENYSKKVRELLSYPGVSGMKLGIGVQGHFNASEPNLAYMRSTLDTLATFGLPIWLTEVSVEKDPNQAHYLEEILREAHAHPAVQGIIIFGGPAVSGFSPLSLSDQDMKNTAAGDVVDKLICEWQTRSLVATTNGQGFFEMSLFHGDYNITVEDLMNNFSSTTSFKVAKDMPQLTMNLHIDI
ncbi:hypothetical protein ACFE04_023260 [Oxalis oulophora]